MKKYFNSQVVYNQQPAGIDKENGIIKGIVVAQLGEAKGHSLYIDEPFIKTVENLGNESKVGIKARFGHPNICSTALGTYLGRYRNFRKVGDKVLADLHLDKSSARSPKGNLYDYILDLAETNPDMFGASIAFKAGDEIIRKVQENGIEKEQKFAVINSLYAVDFVDDPAVTDGLFQSFYEDDFAYQVTTFFDEHPEVFKLIDSKPEILNGFLNNYKTYKEKKNMNIKDEISNLKNWVSENFSNKKGEPGFQEEVNNRIATLETRVNDFSAESESLSQNNNEFEKGITAFSDKLKAIYGKFNQEDSGIFSSEIQPLEKLQHFETAVDTLARLIQSKDDEIAELQSKLNKSLAMPTTPDITADPLIGLELNKKTDFTGRSILENIPSTIRRKLKK